MKNIITITLWIISGTLMFAGAETITTKVSWENSSDDCQLFQVNDDEGLPAYYYMDINQYPCDTKECFRMEVRLYWDMWGNFLKLGLEGEKELTKLNHEPFNEKDYKRLHALLNNPNSGMHYYQLDDLTPKESEQEYYSVDAVSGATVVDVSYESVKGAVKTCYTLWNIIHGDVVLAIRENTGKVLMQSWDKEEELKKYNKELVNKVIEGDEVSSEYLMSVVSQQAVSSPLVFGSMLELARLSELSDRKLNLLLSQEFQSISTEEIKQMVYNYLDQVEYRTKEMRQYKISNNFF